MAIITTLISRFDGGLVEDKRSKSFNKFALTKHFDTMTYPHKLVPYRSTEAIEDKAMNIVKFLYAPFGATAGVSFLYGLATDGATTKPVLAFFSVDTGLSGIWTISAFKSTRSGRDTGVLFYYKDFVYVFAVSTLIRCDITNASNNFTDYQTLNQTRTVQPVHHPADDIAYFFTDNLVHKLNDTSWSGSVLTLPSNSYITSARAYGNYLAIATVEIGTSKKKSVVYLWDRDSSLNTLTERIDFGEGKILHLVNLDNKLFAIIDQYTSNDGSSNIGKGRLLVKQYKGGQFGIKTDEITVDTNGNIFTAGYQKDDKFYFAAEAKLNGDSRLGIWVLNSNGKLNFDFNEEDVVDSYEDIYSVGNIRWIAHSNDGSVNRTNDEEVYTYTSIYESLIFNGGDSSLTKKLIGVEVMFEALPTNGQVVLKYRKDEDLDGSWTTIYTYTTDDGISHGAINIESDGSNLPQYKENQFRIESTGGAVITGLKFKEEIIDKQLF